MNKYSSKLDSFIASDIYNLAMPVLPPADLSIAAGTVTPNTSGVSAPSYLFSKKGTATKLAGFLPTDNPYVRGLGLSSNLADGLVAAASATGPGSGWGFRLRPRIFAAAITGITNVAGTDQLTGGAGRFETHLAPGMVVMWLDNAFTVRLGTILSIAAGGNAATLSAVTASGAGTMFAANTTALSIYPFVKVAGNSIDFSILTLNTLFPYSFFMWSASTVFAPTGKMSVTAGAAAVTGNGTLFSTDYIVGQPIGYTDDSGVRRTGLISAIASNTALTLTDNALATATNSTLIDLNSFIAIEATLINAFTAYTITIDPLFGNGTRRFSLNVMAEIEHTFDLATSLGA